MTQATFDQLDAAAAAPADADAATSERKYPGWVQLAVIIGGSLGCWFAIVTLGKAAVAHFGG